MESKKLARRLDEPNRSGLYVVRIECREQVQTGGAPSASCKLTQELAIVAEIDAQAFGYSEHNLAVGHLLQELLGGEVGPDELALLVATRTQTPLAAAKRHGDAAAALSAIQAGETVRWFILRPAGIRVINLVQEVFLIRVSC